MPRLHAILHLGLKELSSLGRDAAMVGLILYAFTYAVYGPAAGSQTELRNASIGVVDADRSRLSGRIVDALLPPSFLPAEAIDASEVDRALDAGRFTFVMEIPPRFEADVLTGRRPAIQLDVDATAMTQAGQGSRYIESVLLQELAAAGVQAGAPEAVTLVTRARFNPNLDDRVFVALAEIVNNITMLGIILCGAAVVREREHGTLEHLLAMPLTPLEILAAKVWPNTVVIVVAAALSIHLVVRALLGVPVLGSVTLFVAGSILYMFSIASLSILLATIARSMPQFGLLVFVVFLTLNMLSGGTTPSDSMPHWLQNAMLVSPSTHYTSFAIAVLCRGATLGELWPHVAVMAVSGVVFFGAALARFRRAISPTPA